VHTRRRTTYQNLLRWYPPVWDKNFAMILDKGRLTRMQSVIESMPDESVQFSPRRRRSARSTSKAAPRQRNTQICLTSQLVADEFPPVSLPDIKVKEFTRCAGIAAIGVER
jgi:hypothetical protein